VTFHLKALLVGLLLLCLGGPVLAQDRRVALVIGNSAYRYAPELNNPKNDAEDISAALRSLGFEVITGLDLDKAAMDRTIRRFVESANRAQLGLFFYAGHGLQVGGVNYLVPVDARLTTASGLEFEMVRLDVVQRTMEHATDTNVILLDACRDNPLSRNLARALGTRSTSIGLGLAQVEAGLGTLISYSTQPGNVALDGKGRNSPYAGSLIQHITSKGEDLTSILIRVRNDVIKATGNRQVPWDQHALRERVFLAGLSAPAVLPPAPAVETSPLSEAAQAWASIKTSRDVSDFEAFRQQFGAANPFFDRQAAKRIDELNAAAAPRAANPVTSREKTVSPAVPVEPTPKPQKETKAPKPPAKPPATTKSTSTSTSTSTSAPNAAADLPRCQNWNAPGAVCRNAAGKRCIIIGNMMSCS